MTPRLETAVAVLLAASVSASALPALGFERQSMLSKFVARSGLYKNSSAEICSTCSLYEPAETVSAPKSNVWAQISAEDNTAVWNFLHDPATGLNLTDPETAGINDNYVWFIDTVPVNKTDVLPYIDGSGPAPSSYARVIIFEGGKLEPVSQEYMVGPLPVSSQTTIQKLDYLYNGGKGGTVPFNARYFDSKRSKASDPLLASVMSSITDITTALLGGVFLGSDHPNSTLTDTGTNPTSFDGSQAFQIAMFRRPGPATFLQPLDFFVLLDITGTDASLYKLKGLVTNTRFFPTVADLRAAFEAGELTEEFYQPDNYDWALVNLDPEMGVRDLEDKFAPQSVELGGKRYKLDGEQKYVEYMGWSFYVAHTSTLGVMLFDIRFKGERILYELSMQEAAAQYGGFQPKSATTVYHDTYYQLGAQLFPLVEGFDCPFGSTFWDVPIHSGNGTTVNPNAICLFESDAGYPLSRHRAGGGSSAYGFQNLGVVKASLLTVRSIATVGNYDYLFDYAFHVDGSLEITVRASGYLQSSFYYRDQGKWGPRIQEATQGSLHDHVLTWKADFDIIDTANSLQITELRAVNTTQPWWPELGTFEQIELNAYNVETERELSWAENGQAAYCVNHARETNRWGVPRGYRIIPGKSPIRLSTLASPFSRRNSAFTHAHLGVTRQHDAEVWANSVQNLNLPWAPQHDFTQFYDGEGVEDADLVIWLNLGMHHFTRSEDIPVTLYSEAVSSVMFAPQNFFDRAQDGDIRNRRWYETTDDDATTLASNTFGIDLPQCRVELKEPVIAQIL
ncbi:amine oxidase catalytic domain-containing protein [Durotheca rogersii]|uniref:amine oxidase catalytic domain-containing protein n=1 Tax=Durotheca rogersii TaxID=419775 RepID=UPI002220C855|nr:amine oxidase catalytic domain-containing protein [Durotheca rogersii]KAI5857297.1 amine oxidase catalytic domain-containing protein [Durotheca rogersii]